ncbi:MAG: GNAT family N-acetyltransferase [Bdellovibrionales bacterium]|nr:GNAT family N-acetyltransferase [Bdellovibrionales bacterium]
MLEILALTDIKKEEKDRVLKASEEIFFLSSSVKEFASPEKKEAFYKRWCRDYQEVYPEEFFVVLEGKKVLGYLSGCSKTIEGLSVLSVPGVLTFEDLYEKFPAHLHINFHPDARGKGLGSQLIRHYIAYLKKRKVRGLHLITSPGAQNVSFYERLGFNEIVVREFKNSPLQFMGLMLE